MSLGLCDNAAVASGTVTVLLRQTLAQSQHRWLGAVNGGGGSRWWREDSLLQNPLEEPAKPFLPPPSPRPAEMEAHPGLRKSPTMHRFTFPTSLQLQSHSSPASTNGLLRAWQRKKKKADVCNKSAESQLIVAEGDQWCRFTALPISALIRLTFLSDTSTAVVVCLKHLCELVENKKCP